jgi:hypothetical protein
MSGSDDLRLATALLNGFGNQSATGKRRTAYLKGKDEKDARLALARLLRGPDPLDRNVRMHLANLFDPNPTQWEPRTVKFVHRAKGRTPDPTNRTQIAERVYELHKGKGQSFNSAITQAAKELSLSDDAVKKIWKGYRRLLEQIDTDPGKGS